MRWWYAIKARLQTLFFRKTEEAALDEEMRFHVEMETRKLEARGLSATEARRRALVAFGGEDRMRERAREERGHRLVDDVFSDLRHALRGLRRSPGFAIVSILTLSVGIGATTAMYTLVDGVLLRPLPYPDSDRMVAVWERTDQGEELYTSYLNFVDWRAGTPELSAVAAFVPPRATSLLTRNGGVRARISAVTADFFAVGGVAPAFGRLPSPDEHQPGAAPVAVVSRSFWDGPLGGAAQTPGPSSLDGVTLDIDGEVYDVVGVMPASFTLPGEPEVWTSLDRRVPWSVRANHVVGVIARLAPDATLESAAAQLDVVHGRIRAAAPEVETVGVVARRYLDDVVGTSRRALGFLLAASGVLLLIACTNVASTLLARGTARVRELGVRASLGASRSRLVRKLFIESLTLALLGSGLGIVLGQAILGATRRLNPTALPRLTEVSLDGRVLAFTVAVMVLAALAFGLLPALALTRNDMAQAVRAGRDGYDRTTQLVWRTVMGAEAGLAVFLLVAGGLFGKSLASILDRDGGFDPSGVVVGRLDWPISKYDGLDEGTQAMNEILEGLRTIPGMRASGLAFSLPVAGRGTVGSPVQLDDGTRTDRIFAYGVADAGYFTTMGIPLLRGRLFETSDGPEAPHVAVIDEAMAEAIWPGLDPIGRTFNPRGMDPWGDEDLTVIGVVGETLAWDASSGQTPRYYAHFAQRPLFPLYYGGHVLVKTAAGGAGGTSAATGTAAAQLRDVVQGVDRDISVRVDPLAALIRDSASDRSLNAFVLAIFALAALILAAVGVYGVVAYSVARRTREMGIRLALGASASQVRYRVQRDVLATVGVGSVLGLLAVLLLQGAVTGLLYDVSPSDPATLVASLVGLGVVAWVASWIPAWRGTRLDPATVLRYE